MPKKNINERCELKGPRFFSPRFNDHRFLLTDFSPRSQKTQLTQDMYIFEENVSYFIQYKEIHEKSLL